MCLYVIKEMLHKTDPSPRGVRVLARPGEGLPHAAEAVRPSRAGAGCPDGVGRGLASASTVCCAPSQTIKPCWHAGHGAHRVIRIVGPVTDAGDLGLQPPVMRVRGGNQGVW